jgi:tetratricopeptide (TPR) repeat protein
MKVRFAVHFIVVFVLSACSFARAQNSGDAGQPSRSDGSASGSKQNLLHQIAALETDARQAEAAHAEDVVLGRIYARLGLFCREVAQWGRSEVATKRSVALFRRSGGAGELAAALSQLGTLHAAMGRFREAEKEEQEALQLREKVGDRLQIARSWDDIAAISFEQHKLERARDFARKAMDEFSVNPKAIALDRISARYGLAEALCLLKECTSAVPYLKEALEEAKATLPPDDLPIAIGEFLLGFAYWKSGDMSNADGPMRTGTDAMGKRLDLGHPAYLAALTQYAKFLKENRQVEAANLVERRIRQAETVVDVSTIQSGQGAFGFAGLK